MGKLLEDMTRLTGEIQSLRESRCALRNQLAEENRERQMNVAEMCGDFLGTQTRMAERTRAGRLAFLKRVKQTVSGQQRDMREDMAAARRVWAGKGA